MVPCLRCFAKIGLVCGFLGRQQIEAPKPWGKVVETQDGSRLGMEYGVATVTKKNGALLRDSIKASW